MGSLGSLHSRASAGSRSTVGGGARKGELSLRAMVSDIERRVKSRLGPPEYVPRLCDLPLSLLSWSAHRAARAARKQAVHLLASGANPKIDIIPMHQSPSLILAKAYDRSSKQQHAVSIKQEFIDDQRAALVASIHAKMSRAEQRAAALKVRQVQAAWLKVMALVRFTCTLREHHARAAVETKVKTNRLWAGLVLVRWFKKIVQHRIEERIKNEFMKKAGKSLWIMMMGIKVWRKKVAVKKLVDFLRSFKGNYRIKTVVHRFVASAHMIQRAGRDFITCNRTRANIIASKFWDNLEVQYIIKRLEERKRLETSAVSAANKGSFAHDLIDAKMRIEMEKQADKWRTIDARMEKDLQRHRLSGILPNADSLRDVALTMTLPADVKRKTIECYVMLRRKAFVLRRDEIRIIRRKEAESFSKQDASDLLKSRDTTKIDQTVQRKLKESQMTTTDNNPFLLFKAIDKKMLSTIITMVHDAAGTFAIKVRGPRKASTLGGGGGKKGGPPDASSLALPMGMIHPGILAARKQKEEQEKKRKDATMKEAIIMAVRFCLQGQLEQKKLVLREDQKRRRGGVQLTSVL